MRSEHKTYRSMNGVSGTGKIGFLEGFFDLPDFCGMYSTCAVSVRC